MTGAVTGVVDGMSEAVAALVAEQRARIAERPGDARRYLELGMMYDRNSFPEAAVAAYEEATRLDDRDPRAPYHLGRMRMILGDESGAERAYRKCLERAPDAVMAHARLGDLLLSLGELDAARTCFEAARRTDDDHPAGAEGLARVALAAGDAAGAADVLEDYLLRHGDRRHARFLLGTAYRGLGRLDEARVQLELGSGSSPVAPDPWLEETAAYLAGYRGVMGRAVDLGRAGEAERIVSSLQALRREHPDDVSALEKLVAAELQLGRTADALAELDDFLGRSPSHPRAWYLRALVLEASGDLHAAAEAVARAIAVQGDWVPAHELAARLSWRGDDLTAAATSLELALHFGGPKLDTMLKLARARGLLGDAAGATAAHRQAAEAFPQSTDVWVSLCADALGRGPRDLDEARMALERARELAPDDPRVLQLGPALDAATGAETGAETGADRVGGGGLRDE